MSQLDSDFAYKSLIIWGILAKNDVMLTTLCFGVAVVFYEFLEYVD